MLTVIVQVPANYYNFIHLYRVFPKSSLVLSSFQLVAALRLRLATVDNKRATRQWQHLCCLSHSHSLSLRVLCVLAAAWLPFCLCAVGLTVAVTKSLLCTFVFCCALLISNCVSLALALSASLSLTLHVSLGQSVIVLGEAFQGISIRDALLKYAAAFCGSNLVEPFRRLPLG